MKDIIGWKEVAHIHQTISGISFKNGLVKSLLCNTEKGNLYSNKIEKGKITYYVGPKTQSAGIKALFRSFEKGNSFMVFEKL